MAAQSVPTVSSAEFVRRFGAWQDRANTDPIFVTHHGRRRHVMLSMQAYEQLLAGQSAPAPADGDRLRLEILIAQIDGSFVALDGDLTVTCINPVACGYFGVSASAVVGRALGAELPELERSVMRAHLARTLASGEVATFEMPAIAHPGEWLRCSVFPFADGVACLLRNISVERNSRNDVHALESFSGAVHAAERIGAGRLNLRGTFSQVGERLAGFAGFPASALEHVRLTDILPLDRRVEAARHLEAVLDGGKPRGFETALLVNNGGELPVRMSLAPLHGDYTIDGASMVVVTGDRGAPAP